MFASRFEVAAHLRAEFVVIALASFVVVPNTWFANIDVSQSSNVFVNLLLQFVRKSCPMRITRMPIKPGMPNVRATNTASIARKNRKFVQDFMPADGYYVEKIRAT